jgi:hypothetical protein
MPSLFNPTFPPLIQALPVSDHSIAVDATFWRPKFLAAGHTALWTTIFGGPGIIRISRNRLLTFAYPFPEQKSAEVLLWGYPTDMRGIVSRLLPGLAALTGHATSGAIWPTYYSAFPARIGISTITKLAYFHHRIFGGLDALILDQRLIDIIPNWLEVALPGLSYPSASRRYQDYLRVMHTAAADPRLTCSADQLEFFLFALGDSF